MNTSNITKSALALALGLCATGALAQPTTPVSEDFEGAAFASGINGVSTNNLTWTAGSGDASAIATKNGDKVLELDTGDAVVSATIASARADEIAASASAGQTTTFAANVSFTPATSIPEISDSNGDLKFALFAKVDGANTNLCIVSAEGTNTASNITIADSTEKAVLVTFKPNHKFEVKIAGTTAQVNSATEFTFRNAADFSKVEFQGNGTVDDIVFTADVPAVVNVTVTGGANATAAWTIGVAEDQPAPSTLTEGQTYSVTFTANSGYHFEGSPTTTFSGTVGTSDITIPAPSAVADVTIYGDDFGEKPSVNVDGSTPHTLTDKEADILNASVAANGNNAAANTAVENKVATMTATELADAALLNVDILDSNYDKSAPCTFDVTSIKRDLANDKVIVTVVLNRKGAAFTTNGNVQPIKGTLVLQKSATGAAGSWSDVSEQSFSDKFNGKDTETFTFDREGNGNIFKAVIR